MWWRGLAWAAVLIAAAAALTLGVAAVTTGLAAASGLAGVIAAFCELVAAVLAVAGWAGERWAAATAGKEGAAAAAPPAGRIAADQEPATGHNGGKYAVTVGGAAQGVMIGDRNVQNIDLRHSHRGRAHPGAKGPG